MRIYGYENIIQSDTYYDVNGRYILEPFRVGERVHLMNGSGVSVINHYYIIKPPIDKLDNYVWAQHLDAQGHVTGSPYCLPVSAFKPWTQPSLPPDHKLS